MPAFRAPYRMLTVHDRLARCDELGDCVITLEELLLDDEERLFPFLQYDNCRVWVRHGKYSVNIVGIFQGGIFFYKALAYIDATAWGPPYEAKFDEVHMLIEFVIGKFDPLIAGAG